MIENREIWFIQQGHSLPLKYLYLPQKDSMLNKEPKVYISDSQASCIWGVS